AHSPTEGRAEFGEGNGENWIVGGILRNHCMYNNLINEAVEKFFSPKLPPPQPPTLPCYEELKTFIKCTEKIWYIAKRLVNHTKCDMCIKGLKTLNTSENIIGKEADLIKTKTRGLLSFHLNAARWRQPVVPQLIWRLSLTA
ncbi:Uncharacterized protein FWK35_00035430, partial [Aphis craccivora]